MSSGPPSVVIDTDPFTEKYVNASAGSGITTLIRGSRRMLRSFTRPTIVDTRTSSPSRLAHTIVLCGLRSLLIVEIVTSVAASRRSFACWGSSMLMPLSCRWLSPRRYAAGTVGRCCSQSRSPSRVAVPREGYNVTGSIFAAQAKLGRMTVREVDVTDTDEVLAALPGATLVWLESPTNPLLGIADLPVLVDAAHAAGAVVCMDSTFNTPLVLRPLDFGVDVVAHSATKYLAGHSDALIGALVTRDPALDEAMHGRRDMTGAMPGALECFLTLRGLRTLPLRMERAQANALELATRLSKHPAVARVRYPGLPDDPWHERATRLHRGYGAMVSFEVAGTDEDAEQVCHSVELIVHATSLGAVETLIERRARYAVGAAPGTHGTLLRMSVGIEHVDDLWADLSQALASSG